MNTITRLQIIFCSLCLTATALPAVELKVSPNGPLASLAAARDAVRELKAKGPISEPVRILVANGEYPVTEPLVLTPADSGTAQAPISLRSRAGRPAVVQRRPPDPRMATGRRRHLAGAHSRGRRWEMVF